MMLNMKDKKNILAIIIVLIVVLGIFGGIRACSRNNDKPGSNIEENQTPIEDKPSEETDDFEEEKENPGQSEDVSISKPIIDEIIDEEQEEVEEENKYPVINITQTEYTVSLGEDFTIPQLDALDEAGNSLKISITYSFKALGSSDFLPTLEFTTKNLGIYKITYYVENVNNYVSTKDIYVEIVDTEAPKVEGIVTKYNQVDGTTEFLSIESGSVINTDIDISFSDNDIISYVEYYDANLDNSIGGDTIEQEAMPTVNEIDPNEILTLTEEGEYHIRVCDRSGNITEYTITIDKTQPIANVEYEQVGENEVLVTITSNEEMQKVEGFILSSDKKVLTKVYNLTILEDLNLKDKAGNGIVVHLEYQGLKVDITQNDVSTTNRTLNKNDGDIKVILTGQDSIDATYTVDDGVETTYTSGDILTQEGNYKFLINHDGYQTILEFSISSMGTSD